MLRLRAKENIHKYRRGARIVEIGYKSLSHVPMKARETTRIKVAL